MASPTSVFRAGATALITGSASGVGLAVAKLCASHSMNLILVDNNSSALSSAKSTISSSSSKGSVETHSMDVASLSDWTKLRESVDKSGKTLDFLHLNAGIGAKGEWTDNAYVHKIFDVSPPKPPLPNPFKPTIISRIPQVNFFGVVNGINTFYPHFSSSNNSSAKAIVVTGSKQGITNPPGNPAYNASKSALKTLTEHLSFDLAKTSPNTSVHLLVPGWTFTGLTNGGNSTTKPDGAWAPEQVADFLYKKMGEGKFYVMCPDNDVEWETDRKRFVTLCL